MSALIAFTRRVLQKHGVDVITHPAVGVLRRKRPDLVLDVGANAGQFAAELRRFGYRGRIVSFEPIPEAFRQLEEAAARDPSWEAVNVALGQTSGPTTLHLASNSASSSLLPPTDAMARHAPHITFDHQVEVQVERLDALLPGLRRGAERIWLKVDAQGAEASVIAGAGALLDQITAVQLESSFQTFYDGETLAEDMIALMRTHGFVPAYLGPAFTRPKTREWLQADIVFFRSF